MSIEETIVKSRVKLLKQSPFFGTLLLNTRYKITEDISTAATDGDLLMLNEQFMESQSPEHFRSILLHEVLHMALEHIDRMKDVFDKDPMTANLAADIVVNGIIQDNRMPLPEEAITDPDLKHLSVREIYNILRQKQQEDPDYLKNKYGTDGNDINQCLQPSNTKGTNDGKSESKKDKTNWKDVLNKAATIARSKNAGPVGSGLSRIFKEFLEPTINWKDILYKYITSARSDFEGFDRRMIHQGWQAPSACPPVLLTHGRQDPVVPFIASEELLQQLQASGQSAQLLAFDGGHGIDESLFPQTLHH
ncbi:MAG: hypothetical protein EBS77_09690 [Gammaproteobacteria bacterium]|nr:hypothetical protein [Gammaproteobacteria bacterium]